jgi:hypothetical protein
MYPEYEWLPWKFDMCPNNFWEDVKNQKRFLDWAGKELKIKEMSDWYKISKYVKNASFYNNRLLRICIMLAVIALLINITDLFHLYCQMYIPNMSGYHGDLRKVQRDIGMM